MKKLSLFVLSVAIPALLHSQLVVNSGVTPTQLVSGFIGPGLTVSNINLNCAAGAYATFSNGNTTNLGITTGSIFTTGLAVGTIGPNNVPNYSVINGTYVSDPDLTFIEPLATNDPCILTFNVIPSCSTLTIRFVFGSEEYPEWVSQGFNDAFGFFITGPNPSGPAYNGYNIARLPNSTPVSIDNVNASFNSTYYVNNVGGPTIQYDGMTTVITSNLAVVPCSTYMFKIAIADAGDYIYDSGVFIELLHCSTAITATSSSTGSCGCNGTATVNPSGGQPPYTYVWNTTPPQNTQTATGLCPGTYVCTIYDQNGCVSNSNSVSVNVPLIAGPSVTASSTPAGCNVANGSATASPSGGTPGYSYLWNNGQTTQTATGLSAGTYHVIVTDANGCTAQTSVVVGSTSGPSVTSSATQAGCTVANGTATANPTGGTPGYTYQWLPIGATSQVATGLSAGNYTVIVTDANGCSVTDIVSVTTANGPSTNSSVISNVSCFGGTNGSATTNPTGGTPGYTYSWSPSGGNGQTATNLGAGNYVVTITDANGCTTTDNITISQPPAITLTAFSSPAVCTNANNGTATVNSSGGTPGYMYQWSNGQTTQTATGLSMGTYSVTVTDANGCTAQASVMVANLASPSVTATGTNAGCTTANGSATASVIGGTPSYSYQWMPTGGTAQTANNLSSGNYTVIVTDANGCTATATVSVVASAPPSATTSVLSNVSCNGGNNGSAMANASGGTPGYTYMWGTSPVQNTQTATNLSAGTYTVLITDSNGCTATATVTLSQPPPITLSVLCNDSVCLGGTATLSASATGGTPGYAYIWMPGAQSGSTISVSVTTNSTYTVTAVDANGCASSPQNCNVSVIPSPTALFDTASGGIFSSVYSFTDMSTGGIAWQWNFGDGSAGSTLQNPTHTFPGAGTYTVTQIVFNQFGCPDTFWLEVTVGEGIIIPNVFTPDGNNQNDVWYIPNSGMKEFHVEIFDRWGLKVWESSADEIRWDGRSLSGEPLNDGTYYYVLHAILQSPNKNKNYSTRGWITLLTKKK